jgi:hypothetical protein
VHEPCELLSVLVPGSIMDRAMAEVASSPGMGRMAGSRARVPLRLHKEEGETITELIGGKNHHQLDSFGPMTADGGGVTSVLIVDEFQARMGGAEWGNKLRRHTASSWCLL